MLLSSLYNKDILMVLKKFLSIHPGEECSCSVSKQTKNLNFDSQIWQHNRRYTFSFISLLSSKIATSIKASGRQNYQHLSKLKGGLSARMI